MLTNEIRARYGHAAVMAGNPDHNDERTEVVDTLANMLHYCDSKGVDLEGALESARIHYDAEVNGDDIED